MMYLSDSWVILNFGCGLVLIWLTLLGLVTLYDLSEWRIPDRLVALACVIAVLSGGLLPEVSLAGHVGGMLIGGGVLLLMGIIKQGSIGGGDIKWMAVCGWLLGGDRILLAIEVAMMTALIYVVFQLSRKKGKQPFFPMGPFLCIGIGLVYFVRV